MYTRESVGCRKGAQAAGTGIFKACFAGMVMLSMSGCAGNKVTPQDTKERLIYQLSVSREQIDPKDLSSRLFGLPRLERVYDRVSERCKLDGAKPDITFGKTDIPGNGETMYFWLPIRFACIAPAGLASPDSWIIEPSYVHYRKAWSDGAVTLEVGIRPTLMAGDAYVQRTSMAQERAADNERRAPAAQQDQRRRAKEAAELSQRQDEERRARAPAFRANVKVGDRLRLANGGPETSGLIIEVKRPLVFVQFDGMTVMGESRRWIDISQIEPLR
jgi:hypothetical protein